MQLSFYSNKIPDHITNIFNRWLCYRKGITVDNFPKMSKKIKIERPVSIGSTVKLMGEDISIGKYSYINQGSIAFNNVHIGRYTSIAYNVTLGAPDHPTNWLSTHPVQFSQRRIKSFRKHGEEFSRGSSTEIGNDVWIGANAFIGRGVTIGDGAIIAAGAVVVKDVEPYAIVGGCPAKVIKYRFDETTIKKLLALKWWNLPEDKIKDLPFENITQCIKLLEGK